MNTTEETPFDKFTADAPKRAQLLALLDNPVMREAMDLVDDSMRPKAGNSTDSNQPLSIAKFHQSAGANEFITKLRGLTKERLKRKPVEVRSLAKSADDLPLLDQ